MDCSLPGSSVHGIFQARVLEWGAIAFSTRQHIKSIDITLPTQVHLVKAMVFPVVMYGYEFEQALGDGEGWGSLVCCSPWGLKESDTTERLN